MCCAAIGFRQSAYNLVCNAFFAALAVADGASNAVLMPANKVSFGSRNALFGPPYADSVRGVSRIVKDGCVLRGGIFRATYATKPMPATIPGKSSREDSPECWMRIFERLVAGSEPQSEDVPVPLALLQDTMIVGARYRRISR